MSDKLKNQIIQILKSHHVFNYEKIADEILAVVEKPEKTPEEIEKQKKLDSIPF